MINNLSKLVLIGAGIGALAAGGCSSFSGGANYGNHITYPKYVSVLSKEAERLAGSGDPNDLYEAGKLFMKLGNLERADSVAEALLKRNRTFALNLYDALQTERNEHSGK